MQTKAAKKTAVAIPKAGAKSVDPALAIKKALEAKSAEAKSNAATAVDAVDARICNHKNYRVYTNNG